MKTKRWNIEVNEEEKNEAIREAARLIKQGEVVAFPTETVYGLGADATNEQAVAKIFAAKERPGDNPLIVHVAHKHQLLTLVTQLPLYVEALMENFSPGPITYILPSNGKSAVNVTAGLNTVAIRIPDHPIALKFIQACQRPIAAPSANLSGKPSPTTADHVWEDLNGKIAGLLDGGSTGVGLESTVIDCTKEIPVILRPGGITKEEIKSVVGEVLEDPALKGLAEKPKSPGMKYKHYAPEVPLYLVNGDYKKIQQVIDEEKKQLANKVGLLAATKTAKKLTADAIYPLGNDDREIAENLYEGLRFFKKADVDVIVCETFEEKGIGQAIMNRLKKAATKHI